MVAIISPHWASKKTTINGVEGKTNMGLWRMCSHYNDLDACVSIPQGGNPDFPKHSLNAVRAFTIMAFILVFAHLFVESQGEFPQLYGTTGLFAFIALMVYSIKLLNYPDGTGTSFKPSIAFYLVLVACILSAGASFHANRNYNGF